MLNANYNNNTADKTVELKVESIILERRVFNIWRQNLIIWGNENSKPALFKNVNYEETPDGLVEIIKPKIIKLGSSIEYP
jgi:hypothetical protein